MYLDIRDLWFSNHQGIRYSLSAQIETIPPSLLFWTRTRDSSPGTMRAFLHDLRHKLIWPALFSQVAHPFLGATFRSKSAGGRGYGTVGGSEASRGWETDSSAAAAVAPEAGYRRPKKSEITWFNPQMVHCTLKNVLIYVSR